MSDLPETYDDGRTEADETTMEDVFGNDSKTDSTTEPTTETMSEPEPTTDEASGALRGPNEYDPVEVFDLNRHRINGDETIVLLSSFGRGYQALAYDIDKAGEILDTEIIGDAEDRERAENMCQYWIDANPKGILGTEGDDEDSGGLLAKLGIGGGGE